MKTRRAGMQDANINHTGKVLCSPKGLMSQPLLAGLETIRPLGTASFWKGMTPVLIRPLREHFFLCFPSKIELLALYY